MSKIIYAVAGEGYGHSTRSKEVIKHLLDQDHDVKVISHGKGYQMLSQFFQVEEIQGFHLTYQENILKFGHTVLDNIKHTPKLSMSFVKVGVIVNKFKPDVIFTDFEPMAALHANILRIPLISIDNQHILTKARVTYPVKYKKDALAAQAVTQSFIGLANHYLILFFKKLPLKNSKAEIFPPIIKEEVLKLKPRTRDYVLVYLTNEYEGLLDMLKQFDQKFVVYGFNKNQTQGNLQFKRTHRITFAEDLADCQAVIANAGFSLMSEALYLGKPYLGIPVRHQFEQICNAVYLKKLGYGDYLDQGSVPAFSKFLENLDKFKSKIDKYPYKGEDNSKILARVDELVAKFIK